MKYAIKIQAFGYAYLVHYSYTALFDNQGGYCNSLMLSGGLFKKNMK